MVRFNCENYARKMAKYLAHSCRFTHISVFPFSPFWRGKPSLLLCFLIWEPSSPHSSRGQVLNNIGFNCMGSLICEYFFSKYTMVLSIPRFHIYNFFKKWIENIFQFTLGILGNRKLTVCIVLCHVLYKGLKHFWILVSTGSGSWDQPPQYWGLTVVRCRGLKSYLQIFNCMQNP